MRTLYATIISLCTVYIYKQTPSRLQQKKGCVFVLFFSFLGEGVSILWKGASQAKTMMIFKFWMLFA